MFQFPIVKTPARHVLSWLTATLFLLFVSVPPASTQGAPPTGGPGGGPGGGPTSAQFTIGAYQLQSSVRSGTYTYDYTYTTSVTNSGSAATGVVGTVTSSSATTVVTQGTVAFGTVAAGASGTSTGTFTIRQDRRSTFSASSLSWTFTSSSSTTASTTSLVASATSATAGTSITLVATVNPSTAAGTVTFTSGQTMLGSVALTNGVASLTTTALATGTDTVTATYGGSTTFSSSSGSVTVTITAGATTASTTTLTTSNAAVTYASSVVLTASVSPSSATGTVTFYDGPISIGTGTLTSGVTTLTTTVLPVGTHSISAVYGGSSSYATSYSSAVSEVVSTTGSASDCSNSSGTAQIVCYSNAFLATLTTSQQTAVQYSLTEANVEHWSNLPLAVIARNGLQFSTLSTTQLAAALSIAQAAMSADGYTRLQEIRGADDVIATVSSMYEWGAGNYFIAFYGTPSASTPWMLQINGHHFALNHMYNSVYTSGTPYFIGVEPPTYTLHGTTYQALEKQRAAMYALNQSVYGNTAAVLSGTFDDVVHGISSSTNIDSNYPAAYPTGTTGRGVLASTLTTAQQALIKTAIEAWVNDMDSSTAASLLATYEDATDIADTYVGYSGDGTLTTDNDYIRIDGPRVWIEFVVQQGVAYPTTYHFHTLWRDKTADYGGEF